MKNKEKKNIQELSKVVANFSEKVKKINEIEIFEKVLEKDRELYFVENNREYRLFSKNPERENLLLTQRIDFNKDNLIILVGLGNIHLLKYLMGRISQGSRVIIYEPVIEIVKYVIENFDLVEIFRTGHVALMFDLNDEKELEREILFYASMNWGIMAKNMHIIMNPNYHMYKKNIKQFIKKITTSIDITLKTLGNCLEDMFNGFENNYLNIDHGMECNTINEITDKYKGYPAIVVASGPSLDKNIECLKNAQDKALIITCDASLEACKKNEVKPDAIASIERDEPTYLYYYKNRIFDDDLVLVGPTMLWPKILEEYKGKKILMNKNYTGIDQWWSSFFKNIEFVNMGMSSANVAFAVAKAAGCNPIILMGQDLAYTENKKHSDLTHTEFEGDNDSSESDGRMVEDIYGNMLPTDEIYDLFRVWIETQISTTPELEVIDATEGGAKIHGTTIMNLKEAIDKYCTKRLDKHLFDCLEDIIISNEEKHEQYKKIIFSAKNITKRLRKIQEISKKHFNLLEELYKMNIEDMTEKEKVRLVRKMEKGNEIIHIIQADEEIISYYQQIIKQTVVFVKAIGNELTAKNIRRNIELQVNLMQMIHNSTNLICDEYQKLISFLEKKDSIN